MLHNKHYSILAYFLGDYTREIYGRELVGKIQLSQKAIALALKELEKEGILTSRKRGNIKFFSLNLRNAEIKDVLLSLESAKKLLFLRKFPKIANIFKNDSRIVGIFGSYAKGTQKNSSDIDVFIIGNKIKDDYNDKGKDFDLNISIKYFSEARFARLLKGKNSLCREIIGSHIMIFGIEKFISMVWSGYGFD
ncbi:MAG: nucleotidyltransferase domain-containing protein [Nanoarchaeota archaeon]